MSSKPLLIQAENELKVLKRCMGSTPSTAATTTVPHAPEHSAASTTNPIPNRNKTSSNTTSTDNEAKKGVPGLRQAVTGGPGGAWGWVGDVAQRAKGTLARRPPPDAEGVVEEKAASKKVAEDGKGDSGVAV